MLSVRSFLGDPPSLWGQVLDEAAKQAALEVGVGLCSEIYPVLFPRCICICNYKSQVICQVILVRAPKKMTYLIHTSVKKKQRWFSHASGFMVHLPVLATSGTLNFLWKNPARAVRTWRSIPLFPVQICKSKLGTVYGRSTQQNAWYGWEPFLAESLTITNTCGD